MTGSIVEQVGSSIVAGHYSSYSRALTVREVCSEFGVSRSIAREAVKMLVAKGLLITRMSQGAWVQPKESWNLMDNDILRWIYQCTISKQTLLEFLQVRMAIEPVGAYYAADRASKKLVIKLEQQLVVLESSHSNNITFVDAQVGFHQCILEASENLVLLHLRNFLEVAIRADSKNESSNSLHKKFDLESYRAVYSQIAISNPVGAREKMQLLLSKNFKVKSRSYSELSAS